MSAYIQYNSLEKPRFRADICRPVDALQLFDHKEWDSLSIIGEAGLEAARAGFTELDQYEIKLNPEQMNRIQDCVVIKREGEPVSSFLALYGSYIAAGAAIAASIYTYVATKNIAPPSNLNRTQESANNRIQARENEARIGQRVEYICGEVRSFPAKIANEYIVIENNEQTEYGLYSVGEGLLELTDIRDGRTLGESMSDWSAMVYGPYESPMNGATPILTVGDDFDEPIKTVFQSDESVRDEIEPPNDLTLELDLRLTGNNDGTMTLDIVDPPDDYSLLEFYEAGDDITFSGAKATAIDPSNTAPLYKISYSSQGASFVLSNLPLNDYVDIDIGGVDGLTALYEVISVSDDTITLNLAPNLSAEQIDAINRLSNTKLVRNDIFLGTTDTNSYYSTNFDNVTYYYYDAVNDEYIEVSYESAPVAGVLTNSNTAILGPFAGQVGAQKIQFNLLSDALIKDAGRNKIYPLTVLGICTVREVDESGAPTGAIAVQSWEVSSNPSNYRKQAGATYYVEHTFENYTVEFRRTTPRDFGFNGSVQDVVELTELYFVRDEPTGAQYGNKTIIHTRRRQSTFGIGQAKKINMLAKQSYPDGASRFFDDTLYYMAINGKFGRRTQVQADKMRTHLREIRQEIVDYFGNDEAAYFDYTFDSTDITFEDAVNQVAKAVFSTAYQIGSDIRFFPNLLQESDAMVFSHANKQLGKQSLKYSFTDLQDKGYDCVEVKWRNPANQDAQESIFIPSQGTNEKTIELVGIRNKEKAEVHAWREWYRIKYQRFSYECLVGIEATHLVPGRRVGIVNNIAGTNFDGYIKAWDGDKRIQVSQDIDVSAGGYTLVMNMPVGGTEAFTVTQGRYLNELLLDRKPIHDINVTLMENPVAFRVAKDDDLPKDSYSVQEVKLSDKGIQLVGVNYAPEQYQKDDLMSA